MAFCFVGIVGRGRSGILSVTGMTCSGLVPQVICGTILFDVDFTSASNIGAASLASERQSARACVPLCALGAIGAALQELEGFLVRRHHADLGAELDREVADGEPALDLHVADGAAGIFDGVAGAAGGADLADEMQDHVLGRDARRRACRRR